MQTSESGRRTFRSRLNEMLDQLRGGIATGQYRNGTYLPPEKTLAKQFGLSNKTVRKGLEQLIDEGLIEKIPRVGSLVKTPAVEVVEPPAVTLMMGCYSVNEKNLILAPLIDDFQKQFPSIRVEIVTFHYGGSFLDTLQPCLDNGLFDVLSLKDRNFSEMVKAGYLGSLEARPANPQVYPFLSSIFEDDGTLYAQPLAFSPLILAYNLRHFREAGVMEPDASWTWADAVASASRLSVPGKRYGLHYNVLLDERWPVFLLQCANGLETGNRKAGQTGTGEKWLEGIRLCKTILRNHDIFPDRLYGSDSDVGTLFLQGRTSMVVTGYESLNRFTGSDIEYDISSIPYMHDPRTLLTVTGIAVNKMSKHKAEARCLADYLSSPRAQRLIREYTLIIPGLKTAAEAPLAGERALNRPSRFQLYRDIIPSFRKYADLGLPASAIRPLHETLKNYWTDLINEKTLCEQIDAIVSSPPVPVTAKIH